MDTTIQISEKTRNKLVKLKYDLKCKDYEEVLNRLFVIVSKFKLANEI